MSRLGTILFAATLGCYLCAISCNGETSTHERTNAEQETRISVPVFSPDSAYRYVEEQLAFGARTPGSEAHKKCLKYFKEEFERFGAEVEIQEGYGTMYDGSRAALYNVIARVNPKAEQRVMICAHWDCRPWADNDPDEANHRTAVMGANDGASGCGVILEMCRAMSSQLPKIGVDFVLFDLEDSGTPNFYDGPQRDDTWCLGSQYWARSLKGESYIYGILLDMVGAPGAKFFKEGISMHFAPQLVEKVWEKAAELGYSEYFVQQDGGIVTDDHQYVNTIAGIPCINIIQFNPYNPNGFGDYWHTIGDDMRNIDRNTLMTVGRTVMETIYSE